SWIESNNSPKQKIRGVLLQILEKVGENPEQLVIHGESQLKLVEIPQNEPLSLALYESNIQAVRKKEIVIVDPDEELTNILKISFEERDFHVRIFRLGKEALDYLLNPNMTIFPSLVITERKLVDMDGLLILKQLKKNLKDPPPVFILTVFSSDKDISDGLSAGATEYIVKPFNTALLIQKALKAIHENG
ncbi:MAG: response regulator, partial [Cyanobacteria bacterium]|nr:response regulator [Cyanobacteriota bacterium]